MTTDGPPVDLGSTDQLGLAPERAEAVEAMAHRMCWRYKHSSDPAHSNTYTFNRACLLEFAAKLLAAERERCAQLCEQIGRVGPEAAFTAGKCAEAIRTALRTTRRRY
jgi:hypothetical protein